MATVTAQRGSQVGSAKLTSSPAMRVGRIFSRLGHQVIFSKFFQGRPKEVNFVFFHSKVRKQPLFSDIFEIHGGAISPLPPFRRPWLRLQLNFENSSGSTENDRLRGSAALLKWCSYGCSVAGYQ